MKLYPESELKSILLFLAITSAVIIVTLVILKLAVLFAPFLIAFVISSLMEPVIRIAGKRLNMGRKAAVPLVLLLMMALSGYLTVSLISRLVFEIKGLVRILPSILSALYNELRNLVESVSGMQGLPPELTGSLDSLFISMSSSISRLADTLFKGAFETAVSLPEALIFILVTIISTFFMSIERDRIFRYLRRQLPAKWAKEINSIKNEMFSALLGYLKAAMILMSITFFELFIGLSVIHISYSLLMAVIIAAIDALPVLGTGSVLVPWSIFCYLSGNIRLGTSILVLYLVTLIVRQLIEPKILSKQIGIHPLLALISMYAGLKFIGFAGLVLGPAVFLLAKSIYNGIQNKKLVN